MSHTRVRRVAVADLISVQYQAVITPGSSLYKTLNLSSAKGITHEEYRCPLVIWYNFVWFQPYVAHVTCIIKYLKTLNHSAAPVIGQTGRYTGIPRICLSVFKLGWVFALFSWVTQSWLVKPINQFDVAKILHFSGDQWLKICLIQTDLKGSSLLLVTMFASS